MPLARCAVSRACALIPVPYAANRRRRIKKIRKKAAKTSAIIRGERRQIGRKSSSVVTENNNQTRHRVRVDKNMVARQAKSVIDEGVGRQHDNRARYAANIARAQQRKVGRSYRNISIIANKSETKKKKIVNSENISSKIKHQAA